MQHQSQSSHHHPVAHRVMLLDYVGTELNHHLSTIVFAHYPLSVLMLVMLPIA
jgi:hypothetical protein